MLIAWGTCGHAKASATTQCRVCWCLAFESDIDRTNWDPSHEDEDRRLYNAEADRERAHREWDTRKDEANAWEPCDGTCVGGVCANTDGDMPLELRAHFERSRRESATLPCPPSSTFTDVMDLRGPMINHTREGIPFYASRYHVSGEPYAEYLNQHRDVRIEMHGWYTTKARRSGDTTMRDLVGIFDEI